jgi:hypothetical protein
MKKTLIALFAIATLVAQNAFAACPCQKKANPCNNPCQERVNPCQTNRCTGEDWLTQANLEDYFTRMNLDDTQRCEALAAIERFREKTANLSNATGSCASKCECRAYRHALKDLDCDMKNILTSCQRGDYRSVRREVKNQVKCNYKCLINPFTRCASCNNPCD